jgi:hypothetical protein
LVETQTKNSVETGTRNLVETQTKNLVETGTRNLVETQTKNLVKTQSRNWVQTKASACPTSQQVTSSLGTSTREPGQLRATRLVASTTSQARAVDT